MNKHKKIIFFELNEVPFRVFKESFQHSYYKVKLDQYQFNQTISKDECHLSPWITWPTIHRGVTYKSHQIGDLGQNCTDVDKVYPPIWTVLQKKGLKVGVFGSLHSSQTSSNEYKNYSFYVPDVFSAHQDCHPKQYSALQSINLYLSRRSARVVEKRFFPPFKKLIKATYSYLNTSFSLSTIKKIFIQLINEKLNPWKNIRRRTIQSDILFDGFFSFLKKTSPDFATFFTNHVASSMHRFWEASYPDDYAKLSHNYDWINKYKNEISISMESTCNYINKLTDFVNKNPEYELWIVSSMGQSASEGYKPQKQFWAITDLKSFINNIVQEELLNIEVGPAMVPLYSIYADEKTIKKIKNSLNKITTNATLKLRTETKGSLSFYFYSDAPHIYLKLNKKDLELKGLLLKEIKENTSSSAYHVPEGIFYRYGKNLSIISDEYLIDGFLPTNKIKDLILENLRR